MSHLSNAASLTLPQIFERALHFGPLGDEHRRKQEYNVRYYLEFLAGRGVPFASMTWNEFQESDWVEIYAEHLKSERKLSVSTIRQYTNPIRLANRYMRKKHKAKTVEVQEHLPKKRIGPKLFLTAPQLAAAIREARSTDNATAELGFIVGGLAGLNLEEICYLSAGDLDGDVLSIYDSKNEYRERLIPVPQIVQATLKKAFEQRTQHPRAKDPRNALFANYNFLSASMRRILDRCAEKTESENDREAFKRCAPMSARKTFDNIALSIGVPFEFKEGYMGHRLVMGDGRTSEANSYSATRVGRDDLRSVKEQTWENLRREVVARMENAIGQMSI